MEKSNAGSKEEKEDEEAKNRNFGFIPGTTLHSSYVNKSYDTDTRLSSWGSSGNLRASSSYSNLAEDDTSSSYRKSRDYTSPAPSSSSSWSKPAEKEPEMSPYEKYLKRKKEQDEKQEAEKKKADDDRREDERRK